MEFAIITILGVMAGQMVGGNVEDVAINTQPAITGLSIGRMMVAIFIIPRIIFIRMITTAYLVIIHATND